MGEMLLGSSPHIGTPVRTQAIMAHVLIALAPATVFGVIMYGAQALFLVLVTVIAAEAGEFLFRKITKQEIRNGDLSAAVTGLLLALVLPPSTPLWMAALGAVFAIVVAKEFFGGLGANVFNPALIGRAFLLMSFGTAISTWTLPHSGLFDILSGGNPAVNAAAAARASAAVDAVSTATPLGIIRMGGAISDVAKNFVDTGLASSADFWPMIRVLFIGNRAGSLGESSILLILIGFIYLLAMNIIDWRAPLAMAASAFLLAFPLGMNPLFTIMSGGLLFGAVFMATDYTTAPVTAKGKIIFGAGAGIIAILIRKWGNYPEGASYGILIMNAVTPFLNRLLQRKYGYVPKKPAKAGGAAK